MVALIRTRVGHSFIKQVMADEGPSSAVSTRPLLLRRQLAGRLRPHRLDVRARAALGRRRSVLGTPRAPEALRRLGEINTRVDDAAAVIDAVAAHYDGQGTIDRLDGLTVDLDEWWFNLEASNTEPLLRLNLEAADDDAVAARVAECRV